MKKRNTSKNSFSRGKINKALLASQEETIRVKRENIFLIASTLVMFLLFLATISFAILNQEAQRRLQQEGRSQGEISEIVVKRDRKEFSVAENAVIMKVPAVDSQGQGTMAILTVEAARGTGRALIDIESLFFFTDTQESIINSREVSAKLTSLSLEDYDVTYNIFADANSIGGPSAGAALTVATIAALQGKEIREDVIITGRVLSDGSIGTVSGISVKAQAAKDDGAKLFLVPKGQGEETIFETVRKCEQKDGSEVCTVEKVPKVVNVGETVGIEVKEVATIEEALSHFAK